MIPLAKTTRTEKTCKPLLSLDARIPRNTPIRGRSGLARSRSAVVSSRRVRGTDTYPEPSPGRLGLVLGDRRRRSGDSASRRAWIRPDIPSGAPVGFGERAELEEFLSGDQARPRAAVMLEVDLAPEADAVARRVPRPRSRQSRSSPLRGSGPAPAAPRGRRARSPARVAHPTRRPWVGRTVGRSRPNLILRSRCARKGGTRPSVRRGCPRREVGAFL